MLVVILMFILDICSFCIQFCIGFGTLLFRQKGRCFGDSCSLWPFRCWTTLALYKQIQKCVHYLLAAWLGACSLSSRGLLICESTSKQRILYYTPFCDSMGLLYYNPLHWFLFIFPYPWLEAAFFVPIFPQNLFHKVFCIVWFCWISLHFDCQGTLSLQTFWNTLWFRVIFSFSLLMKGS